jgi:large subunit ribosomal protein L15
MPLVRRVPKFGFHSPFRVEFQTVNVETLERLKAAGKLADGKVTPAILYKLGVLSKKNVPVKILGDGELKATLEVSAQSFSKSAVLKIESAGGKALTVTRAGS